MIEIVPMTLDHAYVLAKNLREGDRLECEALGMTPRVTLRKSYYTSLFKRTTIINGKVGACFGFSGAVLGYTAAPWLLTSPEVEKVYLQLALAYRKQVKNMLKMYPKLENFCLADYTKSLAVLRLIGFTVDAPKPYGPKGVNFCKFTLEA